MAPIVVGTPGGTGRLIAGAYRGCTGPRGLRAACTRTARDYHDYVVEDERYMRPAEVDLLVGDASKARRALGWRPDTTLEQLVERMVDADLKLQGA